MLDSSTNTMELSPFDKNCIALLDAAPKRHSRHCFRSAFNHLEYTEKLLQVDPAMAIFRGITAEEEAASGIMQCLIERKYLNAQKLDPRNHVHKNAVIPFLRILSLFHGNFHKLNNIQLRFHIKDEEGKRRLTIAIPMVVNSEEILMYPIPPLNFALSIEAKPPSYEKQIATYLKANGVKEILKYLRAEANIRNKILYAGPSGYPKVIEISPTFLSTKIANVLILLRAYLFIFPYKESQPFVQHALDAYLSMLGTLKKRDLHVEV